MGSCVWASHKDEGLRSLLVGTFVVQSPDHSNRRSKGWSQVCNESSREEQRLWAARPRACQAFCGSTQSRWQKRGRRKKGRKRRKGRDLKRKRRRKQRKLWKLELIYPPQRANSVDYLFSEERPVVVCAKCVVCC